MLLHAVIVDLYYNSDMTHSRVDRAAPTYIYIYSRSIRVPKFADTDPSKKKSLTLINESVLRKHGRERGAQLRWYCF